VDGTEARLKLFKDLAVFEVVLKVPGNYFLQNLINNWQVENWPIISKRLRIKAWFLE